MIRCRDQETPLEKVSCEKGLLISVDSKQMSINFTQERKQTLVRNAYSKWIIVHN